MSNLWRDLGNLRYNKNVGKGRYDCCQCQVHLIMPSLCVQIRNKAYSLAQTKREARNNASSLINTPNISNVTHKQQQPRGHVTTEQLLQLAPRPRLQVINIQVDTKQPFYAMNNLVVSIFKTSSNLIDGYIHDRI